MNNKFVRSLKIAMLCKNAKGIMFLSLFFLVLSPVLMIISNSSFFLGAILSLYSWMFLTQYLAIPELAEVAAASPMKKFMATTMQDIVSFVGVLISFACVAVSNHINPCVDYNILFAYIAISAFTIYFGITYRAYVVGTIVVLVSIGFFAVLSGILSRKFDFAAIPIDLIGFLIILVGWALGVLFRHVLYKIPMSNLMRKSLERQCR